jgi:hypothetical protein
MGKINLKPSLDSRNSEHILKNNRNECLGDVFKRMESKMHK